MAGPIRVLHVDDEADFASLTATFLERQSERFDVSTETASADALERIRTDSLDCVVSDHDMPETTGIELLETVREECPDLPFILFTGKGSEEVASDAISAGVTDYLQKETGTEQYALLANRIENAVERYRSQRAVAEQKRRLETLVSNVPGLVYRCRNAPGWPMDDVAGECEQLAGYPASALESGTVSWGEDVIHPDDRDAVWTRVQDAVTDDDPFEVTYRIETGDGQTKWVWERGRRVTNLRGETVALEGFITDISELKEREQRLREREQQFEAIFNDPSLLVGLLDVDGTTVDVNETALEYVDASRESVVGKPFWDTPWWTSDYRSEVETWIADAADGEYVEYQTTHPTGDGGTATVEGNFRPVTDDDGTVTGIVVSARDVTEQRRRERELKRRNEQFDEFASFVSHDLQSPVSTVQGRLELALQTGDLEHVERAAEALERVDELRTDLVTTLRTGEIVSGTESLALECVMDDVVTAVDPPATASVTVEDGARVDADDDALRRMLENLVGNSVEHGPADVAIRIGALETGFYYEDSGPGIDPAHRERVFTPGFSTKRGEDGIGMGMASVRQIVLAHGWAIHIDDATHLDGVRFEIGDE